MRLNFHFFFDLLSSVQYTDETPKLSLARHQATTNSQIGRREKKRTSNQFENDQSLGANVGVMSHRDTEKYQAEYLIAPLKLEYPVQSWILLPQPALKSYS